MNKAIKYRIYPNLEQQAMFIKTFGCCRKVYNLMLADKIKSYEMYHSFGSQTPAMYKTEYPYLKEVDSLALANTQLNLQQAFVNHFDKKRKKQTGFPKFKSLKHSRKSYTTNNQNGTIQIIDNYIKLPKIGLVKAVIHRLPKKDWELKSATISQDPDDKFYISVLFEYNYDIEKISLNEKSQVIGLDYKSNGLYIDNNGNSPESHKYYRESQHKLKKEQRKLNRKKYGSQNYNKQRKKIAKIYKHIANQRKDFLHKESTKITNSYDVVCVETLDMKAMSNKKFGLGKATLDNGYGIFLDFLSYKLNDRGKYLVKIDKWFPSSQLCSKCGNRKHLSLNKRIYTCNCGLSINRDYNSAINIKNEGMRILGLEQPKLTPVDFM